MARVQKEYWQKRNRLKSLRWWSEFFIMAALFLGVITIPVILAMNRIP